MLKQHTMNFQKILREASFSEEAQNIFLSSGIKELYPPQAEAVEKGVLKGNNLLMSVPTAAGKTLIAELCMVHAILNGRGRCLYIAPLKALASEKYHEFKKKYAPLGIETGLAIGDIDSPGGHLNRYQILVATAEKADSLLRNKAKWLIDALGVVVLDEIHFINDGSRGPTMEILIARIRQLNPNVQLLALSATVKNAAELAGWLNAELVQSAWRPIPLKEGIYHREAIDFHGYGQRLITEDADDDVSKLALDTLRGGGQALIFVNSRRSAQAVARQVCKAVAPILRPKEKQELLKLSKKIAGASGDATKICLKLAETVAHGAAFHHAGLKPRQRELVEEYFKTGLIKVIGCTPTLAAGVNLPARRAIIRDCKRFEMGLGAAYIPTSEYKQCAGRAGRPQYDEYGEAVLIAKTESEAGALFDRYILAGPEPVISKLSNEASLRIHILASIAGGYIHDINGMLDFIQHTFLYHQKIEPNLLEVISDIFEFLRREEFIEKSSGYRFFATPLGALTSRLYIDPLSAIMLRDGLKLIDERKPYSPVGVLHLVTCCPDGPALNAGKKDREDAEVFASHFSGELLLTPDNCAALDDLYSYLRTIKTTWMLNQWIEEDKEDTLCEQFGIGPGDIYRHVESTRWLLYAAARIAELLRQRTLTFQLEDLRQRVIYGVKDELLDLCSLKGVGRVRARHLLRHGISKVNDFHRRTVEDIAAIPSIGKALANRIFEQILNPPGPPRSKTPQTRTPAGALPAETPDESAWVD